MSPFKYFTIFAFSQTGIRQGMMGTPVARMRLGASHSDYHNMINTNTLDTKNKLDSKAQLHYDARRIEIATATNRESLESGSQRTYEGLIYRKKSPDGHRGNRVEPRGLKSPSR